MAEERKIEQGEASISELSNLEKLSLRLELPLEIFNYQIFNRLSPIDLFIFRVSRFFYHTINEFILSFEPCKRTLIHLFRLNDLESKHAQATFGRLIVEREKKLSMADTHLNGVNFRALPLGNLDLKDADCLGMPCSPIKKTDLWNRIEIDILKQIMPKNCDDLNKYHLYDKYFDVDIQTHDVVEHCILYNLANFPISAQLKHTLQFRFVDMSRKADDMPISLSSFLNADKKKRKDLEISDPLLGSFSSNKTPWTVKFSLWVECPEQYAAEFKKWNEEIAKCFPGEEGSALSELGDYIDDRILFAQANDPQKKAEQFMLILNDNYAYRLYCTHPVVIAFKLLSDMRWRFAADTIETCTLLLQEIEKFRGFPRGISEEKLTKIQNALKGLIKLIPYYQAIEAWIKENGDYKDLKLTLLKQRIDQEPLIDDAKEKLFLDFTERKLSCCRDTIESWIEENGGYEQVNLAVLKQKINQENLNEQDKNKLFNEFEEKKLSITIDILNNKLQIFRDNKQKCLEIFKQHLTQPGLSVTDRNKLFVLYKDSVALNRHRNPIFDAIFGIENTTSWRNTWKEIRDDAKAKLFAEVDELSSSEDKKQLLDRFKHANLFAKHRNNFFFEGAFGRTQAVRDIEEKRATLG